MTLGEMTLETALSSFDRDNEYSPNRGHRPFVIEILRFWGGRNVVGTALTAIETFAVVDALPKVKTAVGQAIFARLSDMLKGLNGTCH